MSPVKVDAYMKDLGNVSESDYISIPTIELEFIYILCATRGEKKKVEGSEEISSNLRGSTA